MNSSTSAGIAPSPSHEVRAPEDGSSLIVIAASAGGVTALQSLLPSLPPSLPASIAIVVHRTVTRDPQLSRVLQRWTRMKVKDVEAGETLQRGTIYVAPPDRHLFIKADSSLALQHGGRISHVLSSADPLFFSAADAVGDRVIAVILSGTGRNGATSVPHVKNAGGRVIAQDRTTAGHFAMPAAAIATGAVDYVLPISEIGPMLVKLVREQHGNAAAKDADHS